MKLYRLETVSWQDSQLLYHALPRVGREGVILCSPATPYVCIGYHQELEKEVDLDYCQAHDLPVFRREVGGGAVYLDGNQIFYQIVLHRDHPLAQGDKTAFYRRLLEPVAPAYNDLGVPARYRPVNDIVTCGGLPEKNKLLMQIYADNPSLRRLIDVVPYGLPPEPPQALRPILRGFGLDVGGGAPVPAPSTMPVPAMSM